MQRRGYPIFKAIDLILRSVLGHVSKEEQEECDRISEETGLFRQVDWLSDRKQIRRHLQDEAVFDSGKAYQLFLSRVSRRPFRPIYSWVRIAALWVLPLVAGGLIWYLLNGERPEQIPANGIQPVGIHAVLTFADGNQVKLTTGKQNLSEKDGTLVIQDSGCLVYSGADKVKEEILFNRLTVPRGGEYVLKLADGTKIWLNSESELKYPVQFSGNKREVFLKGEGYFAVNRDTASPFIVHTSLGKVEVLGTEFNVRDYAAEKKVVTTLVNGKVRYKDSGRKGRELELTPGFQVTDYAGTDSLKSGKVRLAEFIGWKDGLYIFNHLSLEEMMKTIERNYDVSVFFTHESLKHLRFSGDLKKYDNVEHFLRFIETGGDVKFNIQGKTITVQPK